MKDSVNIDEMINQEPTKALSWKAILWIVLGFVVTCIGFQFFFQHSTRDATILAKQKESARNGGNALQAGITLFHFHYKLWPIGGTGADWEGNSEDAALLAELLPTPAKKLNTRGTLLFQPGPVTSISPGVVGSGLHTDPTTGALKFLDPWGTPYKIRIDTNNDAALVDPELGGTTLIRHVPVILWSAGPDRDFGTWLDNIKSW